MERESKLRNEFESLTLDEAQVRYELDQINKQLSDKLQERDEAHADRIRALEMVNIRVALFQKKIFLLFLATFHNGNNSFFFIVF